MNLWYRLVADRSNLRSKIECDAMQVRSRRRRADLRLRISVVIQGAGAVRENLLEPLKIFILNYFELFDKEKII